jgi:hypothetical protein
VPPALYDPAAHGTTVGVVEPEGHAYPAEQGPVHDDVATPGTAPYVPAGHGPVHDALLMAGLAPYRPAAHALHVLAPLKLYVPAGHVADVEFVDPAAHAYPAVHGPVQPDVVRPDVAPYRPGSHGPVQVADDMAGEAPYSPATHGVHMLAPAVLYVPAPHSIAVDLVDPAGHAYPGLHAPVQELSLAPATP